MYLTNMNYWAPLHNKADEDENIEQTNTKKQSNQLQTPNQTNGRVGSRKDGR